MTATLAKIMSSAEKSETARGLLSSISNRIGVRQSSATSPQPGNMPAGSRARYERIFNEHTQGKPYLTGIEAAVVFLESRLHKSVLSSIWEQADTSRDGRFSSDEFCHAMWLIDLERGISPTSAQHQQYSTSYASASAYQDVGGSSSYLPAYPLPPPSHQQQQQAYYFPHGVSQPPGPPQLPHATMPYQPPVYQGEYASQPFQLPKKLEMLEPCICQGCDVGLVSGDVVYRCTECKGGVSTFCSPCHGRGKRCYHEVAASMLQAGEKLKNEDKDGDFGFGLKCDSCKTKLTEGMLCWHCRRCFDPNFCQDCWKKPGKRCKHASQGKVQLRRVGKSTVTTEAILDGLEKVSDVVF
ncbi:hypothetical protein NQ176_g6401 [Zarea fungicola]|uniref:Uncharacterized protein n=1 Tax=Zarea fungicola TaxID=93591 RepID=A0ACC1N5S7_9HYPO|nr:hypothetical protein NQ176_g6401 [Lecanicillium fungicola]